MHKLVLIRHGESQWNKENLFTGWKDVDLSDKGIEEAHAAGRSLSSHDFVSGIHISPNSSRIIHSVRIARLSTEV